MSKRLRDGVKERKEKEEYLYSAIYYACIVSKCPDMDHTVLPAKHHACLFFVSVYQMAPPLTEVQTSSCSLLLLIYRPRRDERLSWPDLLTYSGRFTNARKMWSLVSYIRSSAGRKVCRPKTAIYGSTVVPRNQP